MASYLDCVAAQKAAAEIERENAEALAEADRRERIRVVSNGSARVLRGVRLDFVLVMLSR